MEKDAIKVIDRNKNEKELQQMYARTEHWISDYTFFKDEIHFLVNLLDRYFIGAIVADAEQSKLLQSHAQKLTELDKERESIAQENQKTLVYIAQLLKNKIPYNPEEFREEYADIENAQAGFLKRYREIKNKIFNMSSQLQQQASKS